MHNLTKNVRVIDGKKTNKGGKPAPVFHPHFTDSNTGIGRVIQRAMPMIALQLLVILSIVLSSISYVFAANHYIRDGGSGDGSSWSSAWDDMPSAFVRGDTYYIADGSYGSWYLATPISGETYIYIKKATVSDHGTDTGWSSAYGDGQATINQIRFRSSYWIFDGVTGSGSNYSTYGFFFYRSSLSDRVQFIGMPGIGDAQYNTDYITISHCAFITPGPTYNYAQSAIYGNAYTHKSDYITISYCYFKLNNPAIMMRNFKNSVVERCCFDTGWSTSEHHGQLISIGDGTDDLTIRNNIFKNAVLYNLNHHINSGIPSYRCKIYNNITIGLKGNAAWGNVDASTPDGMPGWEIYNNTYVDSVFNSGKGLVYIGTVSNPSNYAKVYNNLCYNCTDPALNSSIIHSNNAFYSCSGTYDGSEGGTAINVSGDPFTDSVGGNYHLKSGVKAIDRGKTLLTPYTNDYDGVTRPQGAGWDIGAYEFVGGDKDNIAIPGVPYDLRIIDN